MDSISREWISNTVASLFNKFTVILEDLMSNVDWSVAIWKYTKQKGLLTSNERISGLLDTDDESNDAKEQRRWLVEVTERSRPTVEESVPAEGATAEPVTLASGFSQWRKKTKTMAPKRKRSKES